MFVKPHPQFGRSSRASPVGKQEQTTIAYTMPSPIAGVNLFDALSSMSPQDTIYSFNMIPSEYGLRTRRGYQTHVATLGGATSPVRTLIPFVDVDGTSHLFATDVNGIYDVTTTADSPTIDTSWGTQSGSAGHGVSTVYNNDNGDFFIQYADEVNGLYEYDAGAGTWAQATDITGVAETSLVFVTEHKERLWYVQSNSMDAWYLALGAKGGSATKFSLGNKFPHGGHLVGIYKWSVDGGDGVDDMLVFVSSAGDVAIYQGTDPSAAATWQALGTWFIGQIPNSRNIAENIGGELHLLSVYGIISVQDLVGGVDVGKATGQNTIARKIARAIRNDMPGKKDDEQWDIVPSMAEGIIMIVRPYDTAATPLQYIFNFTTAGWGYWRDVPINCATEWNGALYFGDDVGNIHIMTNSLDGVARAGTGGDPIEFSFLTAFSDLGAPGAAKRAHYARPRFFSENGAAPTYNTKFLYDYDINEPNISLETAGQVGDVWDTGLWDLAIWGGDSIAASKLIGGSGMGINLAMAMKGEANDRITFLDADIYAEVGGFML